jgi:peroxiredoxin Q/BCP
MAFSFLPPLLQSGAPAPAFRLLDHRGHSVALADRLAGSQGVVLLFFASDFLPGDVRLLERYVQAYKRFQDIGVDVLAVSGINWEKLHRLGQRLKLPFSLVFDPCCRYGKAYQTMWVPRFINGRAVFAILSNPSPIPPSAEVSSASPPVSPDGRILFAARNASPESVLTLFAEAVSSR